MAKDISALVIPAKIDTSGVDRGINQIKSKLSRVRGGTVGGIGGGGAGFSSGIVPYGVGDGFGGAASAAMGAAFGAAAASRNAAIAEKANIGRSAVFKDLTQQQRRDYRNETFFGRWYQRRADKQENIIKTLGARNLEMRMEKYPGQMGLSASQITAQIAANQVALQAAYKKRDDLNVAGTSATTAMYKRNAALTGTVARYVAGGAAIGLGYKALQHIDPLNQQQRNAAPISQFAGTQNYAALAEMKSRAEASKGKFMSFGQAFDVGGMKAAGPYGSTFSETVGGIYGNMRQSTGELLGATMTNPMYGAAMMAMPGGNPAAHQAMAQGMEVAVGSVVLSIENAFKKLFN